MGRGEARRRRMGVVAGIVVQCGAHHVAHRVDSAALPAGAFQLDRSDEAGVRVGDHELRAGEPTAFEVAEELFPERLILRVTNVDTKHFTVAVSTQSGCDDDCVRHDVAVRFSPTWT